MKQPENSGSDNTEESSYLPLYLTLGFILSLIAAYFFWPEFNEICREGWDVLKTGDKQKISAWVKDFGLWGPFFIILLMVAQMFLFIINVMALVIVAVVAYGPVWGSLLALTGILVASTIGYIIGRYWGKKVVNKFIGRKSAEKVQSVVERYGFWAIIVARISPFLSNDAISFIAGTGCMHYLKFMGATIAGITPLIIFIAFLGEDFERLKTGLIWVSVVTILGFLIYYFYDRRKQKNKATT